MMVGQLYFHVQRNEAGPLPTNGAWTKMYFHTQRNEDVPYTKLTHCASAVKN